MGDVMGSVVEPAVVGRADVGQQQHRSTGGRGIVLLFLAIPLVLAGLVLGAGLLLAGSRRSAPPVETVGITLREGAIEAAVPGTTAGLIDFEVTNAGSRPHAFAVIATDLAIDALPLAPDGRIDAEVDGVTAAFESEEPIDAGVTTRLRAALIPGRYVLVGSLPGDYQAGLRAAFTVYASSSPAAVLPAGVADYRITQIRSSVRAGLIDIPITNYGPSEHELIAFATDLPPDRLPLGPDGRIDEEGPGVKNDFDTGDNVVPGETKRFQAALAPGNYVVVCNLPDHYRNGMRIALTVTA
jgi:uncharacterized cupredoxin-like copper-binding protein